MDRNFQVKTLIFNLFISLGIFGFSFAHTCSIDELDKAEVLAEKVARNLEDKFSIKDVDVSISSCEYNPYKKNKYDVIVTYSWYKDGKYYEIRGNLYTDEYGNVKFDREWANENVKKAEDSGLLPWFVIGAIIIGAAMMEGADN